MADLLWDQQSSDVDPGQGMKQSENVQEPQNYGDHNDAVEDGFDRALHGDESVHQPQQDTDHDENFQNLK